MTGGGAGGSGTAQGTTVSEFSPQMDGEPAHLFGVGVSKNAAVAEPSSRTHGKPVFHTVESASGPGEAQSAAVSEPSAGAGEPARSSDGRAGNLSLIHI